MKEPSKQYKRFLEKTCKRTLSISGTLYHTGSGQEYKDFLVEFTALREKHGVTDHALSITIIREDDKRTTIFKP